MALAFLRLQSWLSPSFPNGAYSYSHGLEWAVEAGHVSDRRSLIDWLEADLCHGSGRNEAIFFSEAYRCVAAGVEDRLPDLAVLAAASRGTAEFVLESAQQSSASLATLRRVWPDRILDIFSDPECPPVLAVLLGARAARERIAIDIALPAFLHSYVANLVSAGVDWCLSVRPTVSSLSRRSSRRSCRAVKSQAKRRSTISVRRA